LQARYSANQQTIEIVFRTGVPYQYHHIPPELWVSFKRAESPGRFINMVLNDFPYNRGGWGSVVGQ
jgi:hypothetical protein